MNQLLTILVADESTILGALRALQPSNIEGCAQNCVKHFQVFLLISFARLANRSRSDSESALHIDAISQQQLISRVPGRSNCVRVQVHASTPHAHIVIKNQKYKGILVYVRVRMIKRVLLLRFLWCNTSCAWRFFHALKC
jgi:hypothetical protein